jgi:hypothetical protein
MQVVPTCRDCRPITTLVYSQREQVATFCVMGMSAKLVWLTDDVRQAPAARLGMLPFRGGYLTIDRLVRSRCDRCVLLLAEYTRPRKMERKCSFPLCDFSSP